MNLVNQLLLQALKSSKEVEVVDNKVRCKTDPERWPIPAPHAVGSPRTDFSQLINCPEFVPRQTLSSSNSGEPQQIPPPLKIVPKMMHVIQQRGAVLGEYSGCCSTSLSLKVLHRFLHAV